MGITLSLNRRKQMASRTHKFPRAQPSTMKQLLNVTVDRKGVFRDSKLPGAAFSDFAQYRVSSPERRAYEIAVATYAREIKPSTVRKVVRTARAAGFSWVNTEVVKESAEEALRDDLTGLGYSEAEITWHSTNPGTRDSTLWATADSWGRLC
jgi:hypothetical protein